LAEKQQMPISWTMASGLTRPVIELTTYLSTSNRAHFIATLPRRLENLQKSQTVLKHLQYSKLKTAREKQS
jgi:hypothetical protein